MIHVSYRARCTCGWERSCDAEIAAEVEGEAHLSEVAETAPESIIRILGYNPATMHFVVVETVRTWEEESDAR